MIDKKLSIIIPCYNETEYINKLAIEIIEAIKRNEFEFIFVDDFSTDNTFANLNSWFGAYSNVTILENTHFKGQSGAYATAVDFAQTPYCALYSADCEISFEDILILYERFVQNELYFLNTYRKGNSKRMIHSKLSRAANGFCNLVFNSFFLDRGSGVKFFHTSELRGKISTPFCHRYLPDLLGAELRVSEEVGINSFNHALRKSNYSILNKAINFFFETYRIYKIRQKNVEQ